MASVWAATINFGKKVASATNNLLQRQFSNPSAKMVKEDCNIYSLPHDVIGFDMDHTLVRYKLPAIRRLVQQCLCSHIVDGNAWPSSLLDDSRVHDHLVMKGVILDKTRGNLLRLAGDGDILVGFHGTQRLSAEQIQKEYGGEKLTEIAADLVAGVRSDQYFVFDNFFDSPAIPIVATMIDKQDAKAETTSWTAGQSGLDYTGIWTVVIAAFNSAFRADSFADNTGGFFSALKADPDTFVRKVSAGAHRWLASLRDAGRHLFVLTSSHSDFSHFLLDFSYGPTWKSDFVLVGVNARKPGFFAEPPLARPFYTLENHRELAELAVEDLRTGMIVAQGNCTELNKFFSTVSGLDNPRVAYFGDSLRSDVVCLDRANWDPVAIVEELFVETPTNVPVQPLHCSEDVQDAPSSPKAKRSRTDSMTVSVDADHDVLQSATWLSYFTHVDGKDTVQASLLNQHSLLCVPCLPELPAPGQSNGDSS